MMDTEASKTGKHYRAANGSTIRNYGQRVVKGTSENGLALSLPIQVADVHKVLGSVREMVKAGNRIVFDEDANGKCCSYLEHKKSGKRTNIYDNPEHGLSSLRAPEHHERGLSVFILLPYLTTRLTRICSNTFSRP